MRGFGYSSYKREFKSYSELAEDMYLFMKEEFPEVKDYYVFGHNIGGNVAMELAKSHPGSVKGIVLLGLSAQNSKNNGMYDVLESKNLELYKKVLACY
jgi:pimeloyl-ACP methyl ester carboxylesterase